MENIINKQSVSPINMSPEYQRGYTTGFQEGMQKAYEQFREQLLTQKVQYIIVTQEKFDEIQKSGKI
jgi:flagellar biosynthesis/type III secretory pathway protein FliH